MSSTHQSALDVIDEIEESVNDSDQRSSSQVPYSSSPQASSDFEGISPATSISEVLHDQLWTDDGPTVKQEPESEFVQDLFGRLLKVSRERDSTSAHSPSRSSSVVRATQARSSSRNPLSSSFRQNFSRSIDSQSREVHSERTQSESFTFTFRPLAILPVSNAHFSPFRLLQSPNKRSRPSNASLGYSPYPNPSDSPQSKKRRLQRHSTTSSDKFATRTATFRRALSLRSEAEYSGNSDHGHELPIFSSPAPEFLIPPPMDLDVPSDWIPTEPCSPVLEHSTPLRNPAVYRDPNFQAPSPSRKRTQPENDITKKPQRLAIPFAVPIIAPPKGHLWRPPLSEAAQAKVRLVRFREREERMRDADASWVLPETGTVIQSEIPLESESILSQDEIVDRSYEGDENEARDIDMGKEEDDVDPEFDQLDEEMGRAMKRRASIKGVPGLRDGMGSERIQWILEVLPKSIPHEPSRTRNSSYMSTSECSSFSMISRSFSGSSDSSASEYLPADFDLADQLLNSPETRFHAAYLYMRFFHLVFGAQELDEIIHRDSGSGEDGEVLNRNGKRKLAWDIDGAELVSWDVAVGCLALAVKMHRDFLPPLWPVYSSAYERLAPHEISYDNLEAAQRDILWTLSYNLGNTPQAVLDDLWIALPSLRELLDSNDSKSDNDGWSSVLQDTWLILFEAVTEPEIMKFPLSLLTAAAVMEALISTLVRQYQARDPWYQNFRRRKLSMKGRQIQQIRSHKKPVPAFAPPHSKVRSSGSSDLAQGRDEEVEVEDEDHSSRGRSTSSALHAIQEGFEARKVKERVRRAKIESEGVVLDIQAALGIADGPLKACRKWITRFVPVAMGARV